MVKPLHILHLEDNPNDAELVRYALDKAKIVCRIEWVARKQDFLRALDEQSFDIVLADYSLPDYNGLAALVEVQQRDLLIPFVLVTGALGEERAIESIKAGVTDYILKTNLLRLQTAVPRAIEAARENLQKKLTLEALRLSEERFDLAVRGSGAGIWDWGDVSTDQMWWSPRIYEILGFEDGKIPATRDQLYEMIHPDDVGTARRAMQSHFIEHKPYDVEFRLKHKLGHYIWIRSRGQAIVDAEGRPTRMAGYVQDISDRKLAQKALRAREKDLLRAQQVGHVGSWYLDIDMDCLRWTDETYRIFGFVNHEDFGGTIEAFLGRVHPDDRERVEQAWNAALAGQLYDIEHRILLPDGEIRHVREMAEIEFDDKSQPVRVTANLF
jgi:two-component system sensor histidine kinase UhpB